MKMRLVVCLAALLAISNIPLRAADAPAETPSAPPSTKPTETLDVKDAEKLKAAEGQTVSVRGKVSQVFTASSGRVLFNFEGIPRKAFNVMIQKENADAVNTALGGTDLSSAVTDKTITVTGKLTLYRESPQIEVTTPDQIKIEPGDAATDKPADKEPADKEPADKKPAEGEKTEEKK